VKQRYRFKAEKTLVVFTHTLRRAFAEDSNAQQIATHSNAQRSDAQRV